ncbi:Guanine deaminase [Nymphon striatum]|nr:Guanine deaminase [Nymphon striatum]
MLAWQVGIGAGFIGGIVAALGAIVGPFLKKVTPRAGMLGTLCGIALVFIGTVPLATVFEDPIIGFASMIIILWGLVGRFRLPFNIPAGLLALIVGKKMTSKKLLLRGRILSFTAEPTGPDDSDAYSYIEDGALLISDGIIVASGNYQDMSLQETEVEIIDHRPNLLMAGFIDPHLHFPQTQVIASWGAQLLDWLNTYTFPEETRFADPAHSSTMAKHFYDQMIAHGTTTAVAFCSVHKTSADAYFQEAENRNMRMIGGKVMMDRNAPEGVLDTPQSGYDDTKALIKQWHGKGRTNYAITPRFAITSSPEQLEMASALAAEHPDCYIQTHLSENHDEIALTAELYPKARDYLDVYQTYNLLGPKMLLGHSIHLETP